MEFWILSVFVAGYLCITLEQRTGINKTAVALLTGVAVWVIYMLHATDKAAVNGQLIEHLGDTSSTLFFLMGAMTIIELIDAHNGFELITDHITQNKKRVLVWIVGLMTFFFSSVLDNLTTTIVMVSLLRKLIDNVKDRMMFTGVVVIAANAGGAWTPIGDVTTTMLWIGGQISASNIMLKLFLPSLVSLLVPLLFISRAMHGYIERAPEGAGRRVQSLNKRQQVAVLCLGLLILIMVPVFKTYTHLPPFMGMLFGVGVLWVVTEIMQRANRYESEEANPYSLVHALHHIDMSSILFFLGILTAVAALEVSGILATASDWLMAHVGSQDVIILIIGLVSSVVDNVPLVAATQGMYSLSLFPMDNCIWELLAYAAGTGGSILIIGSAAGVAAMGMEKINFMDYAKRVTPWALLGYFAGAFVYFVQNELLTLI